MALTSTIAAAASAIAGGMYLDAKYNIRDDLAQLRGGRNVAKYLQEHQQLNGDEDYSFYHLLHMTYDANHHTKAEALVFEGRSWTYRQLREEIGRLAEAFARLGIRNRTVVAMFVNNSPEFVFAWWALYKLGAIPAPINTGITGEHIRHCMKVCSAEYLVSTYELYDVVAKTLFYQDSDSDNASTHTQTEGFAHHSLPKLKQIVVYDYNTYPCPKSIPQPSALASNILSVQHDALPPTTPQMALFPRSSRPRILATDASQYLFTSGTTGLPKVLNWPAAYSLMSGASDRWPHMHHRRRRWYVCLPMFHGTATFAILPACHTTSGTIVLARRFSRRAFWADVRAYDVDSVLYIGEMLRYLVQAPPDPRFPDEKDHKVDLCYGLGLAPSVWAAMRERFGIPWIAEYYSASEATGALINSNRNGFGIGKIARWGPIMRNRRFGQQTFYIVRTDFESGELVRDAKTGFCRVADVGEVGEIISRVAPPVQRRHEYVGDGSGQANDKKYLRDVFRKGDEFARLGDAVAIVSLACAPTLSVLSPAHWPFDACLHRS